jgi:hypothetical protein
MSPDDIFGVEPMRKSRYSEKKRLGLVPHRYPSGSEAFALGAHRNWPKNCQMPQSRTKLAERDAQAFDPNRHHRFVGPQQHTAVRYYEGGLRHV